MREIKRARRGIERGTGMLQLERGEELNDAITTVTTTLTTAETP